MSNDRDVPERLVQVPDDLATPSASERSPRCEMGDDRAARVPDAGTPPFTLPYRRSLFRR